MGPLSLMGSVSSVALGERCLRLEILEAIRHGHARADGAEMQDRLEDSQTYPQYRDVLPRPGTNTASRDINSMISPASIHSSRRLLSLQRARSLSIMNPDPP